MRIFLSVVQIFFTLGLFAQEGAPLLTHIGGSRDIENQSWAICQDSYRVMLFANRKGITSFDGTESLPVRIGIIPFTMKLNPYNNTIYVGSENCYGFIERDPKGMYRYESLDSAGLGLITRISFNDSIAVFYGDKSVSCYNFKTNTLSKRFFPQEGSSFTGMFLKGNDLFINISNKGLHRVESASLFPLVTGYLTEKTEILFSLPYDSERKLLGFSNGKLSLFDGIKYYDYQLNDDGYIASNVLSEGISVGDSLYAFSTLGGGAVVSEKFSGRVRFIINNQMGLPDDEIFAIGNDASGGLWLSHPFGLTRVDLSLPIGNYGIYQGLKGNISTSLRFNDELYVATSEGIFYLANEKSYDEVEVLRENVTETAKSGQVIAKEITEPLLAPARPPENTRKNVWTRLFGKKAVQEEPMTEIPRPDKNRSTGISALAVAKDPPAPRFRKETIRTLKSVDFMYKKIEGLNEKCRQLVPTENGILAATNIGLYVIREHKATLLEGNRYVNFISWKPYKGKYSVGAADGYFLAKGENNKWSIEIPDETFREPVYSIIRGKGDTLWLGGDDVAYMSVPGIAKGDVDYKRFTLQNNFSQRYLFNLINDTIFLLTETGVNFYDDQSSRFMQYTGSFLHASENEIFKYPVSNLPLIVSGNDWKYPELQNKIWDQYLCFLKLFDDIVSVYCQDDHIWVVDGNNRLFGINCAKTSGFNREPDLLVKNIHNGKGTFFSLSEIVFERGDNIINFEIVVPGYLNKNLTQYQYYIDRIMTDWSPWSGETNYGYGISTPGDYTLMVRAKDLWGQVGEPVSIKFTMKAPFTHTTFFYVISILLALVIIFAIIHMREKQLQEKNRILEDKVRERTAEIEAQKEEITSSIAYASRIQMAMLPVSNLFNDSFSDFFIIFKPRDIVSGDFYWIGQDDRNIFLTVADCTGHGVPGAFMSTLGISILNEIVTNNRDLQANTFLNLLRQKIKTSLHQTGKEGEAADGMDISLCVVRKNRNHMQFSGAYNSLFLHTNGDLKEYKADRMPIGIHYGDEPPFTNYDIRIKKGDVLYLLSDGLTDQFGGPEGSKYKKAQLKKLFADIHYRPMDEQKKLIELEFLRWKGRNEQVDDVTVIGVRI